MSNETKCADKKLWYHWPIILRSHAYYALHCLTAFFALQGRPSEQEAPPPEMPSWQQRQGQPYHQQQRGGGGSHRGGGGGGGGHRGGGGGGGGYHGGGGGYNQGGMACLFLVIFLLVMLRWKIIFLGLIKILPNKQLRERSTERAYFIIHTLHTTLLTRKQA